jgi:hypothetical protein
MSKERHEDAESLSISFIIFGLITTLAMAFWVGSGVELMKSDEERKQHILKVYENVLELPYQHSSVIRRTVLQVAK